MANMVETLNWLAVQFRDRANDDPAEHTEQDASQVEAARETAFEMLAALRPFAEALERVDRGGPDEACFIGAQLTLGDLRAARNVIAKATLPAKELSISERIAADKAWALSLTDGQLTAALYEMRDRGAAVAYYDADALATMFDDGREWDNFMAEERDALEEAMCERAREYANSNGPAEPDDDEEEGR